MKTPPIPENEFSRLEALRDLNLLDSPPEARFDRLTRLAKKLFDVPIALISLVDKDRQWFKSKQGLGASETHRDISFCGHAILEDEIYEICDASKHPNFVDNPLVVGAPNIRFYAGVPLSTDSGDKIGTLCIIDSKPRQLSADERITLRDLADLVEQECLNLDKVLREQELQYRSLVNNIPGVTYRCLLDENWTMLYMSDQVDPLSGYLASDFINNAVRTYDSVIHPDDAKVVEKQVHEALDSNVDQWLCEYRIMHKDGSIRWAHERGSARRDEQGKVRFLDGFILDITERKLADEALLYQRWLYETILEQSLAGYWDWNIPDNTEYLSPTFKQMFGYDDSEMENTPDAWQRIIFEEDLPIVLKKFDDHVTSHGVEPYACEVRFHHKNGGFVWIHCTGKVVEWHPDGTPMRMVGCHHDITSEKQDAERIKLSERRLASIIEGTNIGTWEWYVPSGLTIFNERWAEIVGYRLEELSPLNIDTWTSLAHPDDLKISGQLLEDHFSGKSDYYDCIARMRHKKGHWVWVHDRGRVVSWTKDGKPFLVSGTHADITEQKNAELALKANEARLRGLFELSPIGIALNDFETGQFIDLNPALLAPSGYTREEFVELSYWDVTPMEYEAQEQEQLEMLRKTGRYGPFEKEYIRKDGSRYPVLLNGMIIEEYGGKKLIWSMIEDISERKRIEKMKNDFISTVSHELRTPLTAISGALGLIRGGVSGEIPKPLESMLDIAVKNGERLNLIINDLLDMEKLLAGKMVVKLVEQDLLPLLRSAIETNQSYANQFDVILKLVEQNTKVRVCVDDGRFSQIMANLLSNAAKFSPKGGVVDVFFKVKGGSVYISVRDYGEGIPAEFQEQIFQKFCQADSSDSRKKGGTGLGLAITRELVERMQGEIGFNTSNDGTEFFFNLPVVT